MPSNNQIFTYAIEEAVSISKIFLSESCFDSFILSEDFSSKDYNSLIEIKKLSEKLERAITLKMKWEDEESEYRQISGQILDLGWNI